MRRLFQLVGNMFRRKPLQTRVVNTNRMPTQAVTREMFLKTLKGKAVVDVDILALFEGLNQEDRYVVLEKVAKKIDGRKQEYATNQLLRFIAGIEDVNLRWSILRLIESRLTKPQKDAYLNHLGK